MKKIMGLVGLSLLASCSAPSASDCPQSQENTLSAGTASALAAADLPEIADAPRLAYDFATNEVAASQKYGGKPALVRGEVDKVEAGDQAEVSLANDNISTVKALLPDLNVAAKLKAGDVIVLFCKAIDRPDHFTVQADGCALVGQR